MDIVNQAQELITNWIAIYGPAILTVISSIGTAIVVILKVASAIKNARKEFANNEDVKELTSDVNELKDHIKASDKENRELKELLRKELAAKTRIKED